MDFTREPLVETVITSKEGFKLVIRSSGGNSEEEYSVGALEVVSFGNCYFFRSLEKPKAFLLPMTKYEVVETRETRTVLKRPQIDKTIKIRGGRQEPERKEIEEKVTEEPKKREKKRTHKRPSKREKGEGTIPAESDKSKTERDMLTPRRTLLPPPTSLISDQIDRYKNYLVEQGALIPDDIVEEEKRGGAELSKQAREKGININEEAHIPENDQS